MTTPSTVPNSSSLPGTWWGRWQALPLYVRILVMVVLGLTCGLVLGKEAAFLKLPSSLILQLLGVLASPLILLAIVQTLMHAEIPKYQGLRLVMLLVLNTLVAIFIGLAVANVVQPGRWSKAPQKPADAQADLAKAEELREKAANPLKQFLENVPRSALGPFTDQGKVISVIIVALALGIALRQLKGQPGMPVVVDLMSIGFQALIKMLHWIIELIPLAIFCVVASQVGVEGLESFKNLGGFMFAVLLALALQLGYYLLRIRFGSWARPWDVLHGVRDALVMAFSTGSSTATMPVTYACLRTKVGLREQSASLGALVGANFNNDGTALYEAMSALFIAQLLGMQLSLGGQFIVAMTSVVASVGAAGIPEAGLVTMTLVFSAVGLPTSQIPMLLTVDWFLDRCRTAINVMGDVNVSCLLDGHVREVATATTDTQNLANIAD